MPTTATKRDELQEGDRVRWSRKLPMRRRQELGRRYGKAPHRLGPVGDIPNDLQEQLQSKLWARLPESRDPNIMLSLALLERAED